MLAEGESEGPPCFYFLLGTREEVRCSTSLPVPAPSEHPRPPAVAPAQTQPPPTPASRQDAVLVTGLGGPGLHPGFSGAGSTSDKGACDAPQICCRPPGPATHSRSHAYPAAGPLEALRGHPLHSRPPTLSHSLNHLNTIIQRPEASVSSGRLGWGPPRPWRGALGTFLLPALLGSWSLRLARPVASNMQGLQGHMRRVLRVS